MDATNLLDRRMYTFGEADRILGLSAGTARRWIDGYRRSGLLHPPVIRAEATGDELVTWGEFVETRLLSEYRHSGVPLVRLRPAVGRLRQEFGPYPLAHAAPFLEPRGRELVLRIQDSVGLARQLSLVVVRSGQLVLSPETEQFVGSVEFGDLGQVSLMRPDREVPDVVIDPLRAFGEPAVRAVSTEVIAEQARAGDSLELLAGIYELALDQVQAAVRFERRHAA